MKYIVEIRDNSGNYQMKRTRDIPFEMAKELLEIIWFNDEEERDYYLLDEYTGEILAEYEY